MRDAKRSEKMTLTAKCAVVLLFIIWSGRSYAESDEDLTAKTKTTILSNLSRFLSEYDKETRGEINYSTLGLEFQKIQDYVSDDGKKIDVYVTVKRPEDSYTLDISRESFGSKLYQSIQIRFNSFGNGRECVSLRDLYKIAGRSGWHSRHIYVDSATHGFKAAKSDTSMLVSASGGSGWDTGSFEVPDPKKFFPEYYKIQDCAWSLTLSLSQY